MRAWECGSAVKPLLCGCCEQTAQAWELEAEARAFRPRERRTSAEAQTVKDRLRKLKREREGFRSGAEGLRAEHGTVTVPILLEDYDAHYERREEARPFALQTA